MALNVEGEKFRDDEVMQKLMNSKKQEDLITETLKIDIVFVLLIPGKKAPLITENMINNMQGSIIYDLAAIQGGNSALQVDKIVEKME